MLTSAVWDAITHKAGWMVAGIFSSAVSVSIPFYQEVWIDYNGYGITGLDIGWGIATTVGLLSVIKISLAIFEHILNIKKMIGSK